MTQQVLILGPPRHCFRLYTQERSTPGNTRSAYGGDGRYYYQLYRILCNMNVIKNSVQLLCRITIGTSVTLRYNTIGYGMKPSVYTFYRETTHDMRHLSCRQNCRIAFFTWCYGSVYIEYALLGYAALEACTWCIPLARYVCFPLY